MTAVSRILVGIDLHGEAAPVVAKAARLASAFDATLELFAPVYNTRLTRSSFPEPGALERARARLVRDGLARLRELGARLGGAVEVECEAAWDHPADEAIIRRAVGSPADLVLVALKAHPEHRLPFFSGADWQLARHCPAPLILCRPQAWRDQPVVVAALDPTHGHGRKAGLDVRILELAESVSAACGGRVAAFHAFEPIVRVPGDAGGELPVDAAERALEEAHAAAVEAVFERSGIRPALLEVRQGSPEEALPDYCREAGADVVVMGAVARNPLGRIFIGSTAEKVLHLLPCDVLIVKPEGFRAPVPGEPYTGEAEAGRIIGVPGI